MKHEPMTQERLDAIRERVAHATPGPWGPGNRCVFANNPRHPHGVYAVVSDEVVNGAYGVAISRTADVDLIAHAPDDLTDLLAEVERLRALTTVGDDMVERAAFTLARRFEKHPYLRVGALGHDFTPDARAALDAALGTGEGA